MCGLPPDRLGSCERGHPALVVCGVTWSFRDWKANLIVDRDAPVLAWRQEKGRRLGWENSHEALAWNVVRGLELAGRIDVLGDVAGLGHPTARFWARERDGSPWTPFEEARALLEEHLRGPDVNFAAPDVALVEGSRLVFVDAGLAAPLTGRPPRWFASAPTPAARRRRRAILESLLADEPDPRAVFRRGVDELIRRGFYSPTRRFLLARATARRLGPGPSAAILLLVNPPTMRHCLEDVERFRALLTPAGAAGVLAIPWRELFDRIPGDAAEVRAYLAGRTVNRGPAHLCG